MAFGNVLKKEPKKEAPPQQAAGGAAGPEGDDGLGGWNNVWGALAARDGLSDNINPNIYGEITADGCALMFKNLPTAARLDEDSIIYDLGSGYGKLCIWCATVAKRRCIGIENNPDRAALADKAKELAISKGFLSEEEQARVTLITGDAFAEGAFLDATHIYMCNVGYSEDMHLRLLDQVPKCKNLKAVITITAMHEGGHAVPAGALEKAGVRYEGSSVAPTTWDAECKVHYYTTAKGREPEPLRLKLADAEKFQSLVNDVYGEVMANVKEA
mmetsp:Transcript_10074/g.23473  ORF Transcript_10074/g.23473 Transcript_10074/m.23473 type:complete len:272 (+) Transcript_10074:28-843(+)|eukprot:CAMPEP_0177720714 /NCGR_PEP_ID=MMETSP0484_2-20121128/16763_1 /TAXON_ID=354590 /ORGANISM="Rhodomonas lens, Strain RHODO" /LENGTH=271 /DNA_ID=CAMNT_0019232975 /DNA_START=28 /DNA_END=843 /DNA_ORIENTATION=+